MQQLVVTMSDCSTVYTVSLLHSLHTKCFIIL